MATTSRPTGVPTDERPLVRRPNTSEPQDPDGRPRGRASGPELPTVLGWVAVAVALAAAAWLLLTVLSFDDAPAPASTPVELVGSDQHLHNLGA